jgi:hypothetical protein
MPTRTLADITDPRERLARRLTKMVAKEQERAEYWQNELAAVTALPVSKKRSRLVEGCELRVDRHINAKALLVAELAVVTGIGEATADTSPEVA